MLLGESEGNTVKLTLYEQLQSSKSENEKKKDEIIDKGSTSFEIVGQEKDSSQESKVQIDESNETEEKAEIENPSIDKPENEDELASAFDKIAGAKPAAETKSEVEFTIEENVEKANEGTDEDFNKFSNW